MKTMERETSDSQKRSKILITSLGVGKQKDYSVGYNKGMDNYDKTSYKFDDEDRIIETPFIMQALIQKVLPETIVIVGTIKSCWENLASYYWSIKKKQAGYTETDEDTIFEELNWIESFFKQHCNGNREDIDSISDDIDYLEKILSNLIGIHTMIVLIQYGITKEELDKNYRRLKKIESLFAKEYIAYHITMDITHSFRSLPLFQYVFMNYLRQISNYNVTLESIYYGMMEAIGELEYAPIVNLTSLNEMMNWINCASEMNRYGNVKGIVACMNQTLDNHSNDIVTWLMIFEWAVSMNDYSKMQVAIEKICALDENYESTTDLTVQGYDILHKLILKLKRQFRAKGEYRDAKFQYAIATWYLSQGRYGIAALVLQEALKTFLATLQLQDRLTGDASDSIRIGYESVRKDAIRRLSECKNIPSCQKIYKLYTSCKVFRNTYAHNLRKTVTSNQMDIYKDMEASKKRIEEYRDCLGKCFGNAQFISAFRNEKVRNFSNENKCYTNIVVLEKKENRERWDFKCVQNKYLDANISYCDWIEYTREYSNNKQMKADIPCIINRIESLQLQSNTTLFVLGNTDFNKMKAIVRYLREKGYDCYRIIITGTKSHSGKDFVQLGKIDGSDMD